MAETGTTAKDTRGLILSKSHRIVEELIDIGLGHSDGEPDKKILLELFKHIAPVIRIVDDPLGITESDDKRDMITQILKKMQSGDITIEQADLAISAISKGVDVNEIEDLFEKVRSANSV